MARHTPDAHKRKYVQHKTKSGANIAPLGPGRDGKTGGRGGGFKVGPAHAPDGSYLGKAKKRKAQLIENAKVKAAYYARHGGRDTTRREQERKVDGESQSLAGPSAASLGRFAPEDEDTKRLIEQAEKQPEIRLKQAKPPRDAVTQDNGSTVRRADPEGDSDSKQQKEGGVSQRSDASSARSKGSSREEALQDRKRRSSLGGKVNRKGQPNLGARVGLLLDKLQR
ncbi:hypothetical protein IE81DRAFT_322407 [Ceraceosorus guamensis]|uniref:rRNA-processing protein FYV7 n=1 Tax=Ceraceosorus guamensis TaxID=1522189 RepID=A0A316W203_9BASI|nr:hypothetical protein IE81DRAFT_322407 [Ceraceosorus guamensis]PWN43554.1 hypothetical protein IE81DRAFT_322407 [Ceraceosorus guamensis]